MIQEAIKEAEELVRILDPDFWAARGCLGGSKKQLINKQVGVDSIRFANLEQARKIKELTMEGAGSMEVVKKVTLNIDTYKAKFNMLVIDGEESLRDAESLQSQVKAAKAQVNAATKLEWQRAKKEYDDSKEETEKKKKIYIDIRDTRNMMINACSDIFTGIKAKIEDFHAELRRKAEEKRLAEEAETLRIETEKAQKIKDDLREKQIREAEEKAVLEAQKKFENEKATLKPPIDTTATEVSGKDKQCEICGGEGEVMYGDGEFPQAIPCPTCNVENQHTTSPPQAPIEQSPPDVIQPPQKEEDGKNEQVAKKKDKFFLDVDVKILALSVYQGMAPESLLRPDREEIRRILKGGGTVPGCKFEE